MLSPTFPFSYGMSEAQWFHVACPVMLRPGSLWRCSDVTVTPPPPTFLPLSRTLLLLTCPLPQTSNEALAHELCLGLCVLEKLYVKDRIAWGVCMCVCMCSCTCVFMPLYMNVHRVYLVKREGGRARKVTQSHNVCVTNIPTAMAAPQWGFEGDCSNPGEGMM